MTLDSRDGTKSSHNTTTHRMFSAKGIHRYWLVYPLIFLVCIQFRSLFVHKDARETGDELEGRMLSAFNKFHHKQQTLNDVSLSTPKSRFAYAFLVAGCDPSRPSYRGFLYNVLIAKHILREEGSKADVVLMLRMASNNNNNNTQSLLPPEEEKMLRDGGVLFRYLPPLPRKESFYSAMMAKFHILNLTEYSRVIYMDADIMPLCNLDYVFHLSERGVLKANLVVSWWFEPASGGFFMLKPEVGAIQELQGIIEHQQALAKNKSLWPPFDVINGWGHPIQPNDKWKTLTKGEGTNWTFQFAFADQGLLYHWVKYVKKNESIVYRREVQNWSGGKGEEEPQMEQILKDPFRNYTCQPTNWEHKIRAKFSNGVRTLHGLPLYHDFMHFTGKQKPWEGKTIPPDIRNKSEAEHPIQLWFHILRKVKEELQLPLDVNNLGLKKPVLGRYPSFQDMVAYRET